MILNELVKISKSPSRWGKVREITLLNQEEVEKLYELIKIIKEDVIQFPDYGQKGKYEAESKTTRDVFVFNIVRGSKIKPKKCSYQISLESNEILFRIDLDGSPHPNPDGEIIPCPHIHVYKYDGTPYIENWAFPLNEKLPTNPDDLAQVFIDFLKYNNVENIPIIIPRMEFT